LFFFEYLDICLGRYDVDTHSKVIPHLIPSTEELSYLEYVQYIQVINQEGHWQYPLDELSDAKMRKFVSTELQPIRVVCYDFGFEVDRTL
jgi:hypothetical protein